ncbi:MAG TPA: biopolymer transporter ExbD [Candidatus Acidoferrales bacterium]|nr:biopolymer transporter ExbD [Candidatus Acidoferrales bacterium]
MGMDVGSKNRGPLASMNVIPLIDILLVLIVIFMVITPLAPKGLEAMVPETPKNVDQARNYDKVIVVQVLGNDRLKINEDVATWDTLGQRLEDIFKLRAEKVAFVRGDDVVRFSEVARAIDVMRSSSIERVGLLTAQLDTKP